MSEATRIEQAIESAEPETFDLSELLEATVDAYRQTWPERTFECVIPERPVHIDGVPDLVAQLLDKLVGNALDFGDPATTITFRLERDQKRWRLQVENRGSSIPPGVAERLFDSLVTERPPGRRDPEDSPHLGLGLHIARLIAELHRGEIEARNVVGPEGLPGVVVSTWFPPRGGG